MGMGRVHVTIGMGMATLSCVPIFPSVDSHFTRGLVLLCTSSTKSGYKILIDLLSHFLRFHIFTVRVLRSPNTYAFNTF